MSDRKHDIRDSKLGYLLCVLCGHKGQTEKDFESVKCKSIAEWGEETRKQIEREQKEAGSYDAWLAKQSPYVRGEVDWHDTLLPEDRALLE